MTKLNTKKASSTHSIIIYGCAKSGKTLLAGELSERYNLIWIDIEKGYETLFQLPEEWQERIELITLPDTRSYPIAIETCLKLIKSKVHICQQHGKVNCIICKRGEKEEIEIDLPNITNDTVVIFDSLTQLTNSAISHITKKEADDYKLSYNDWAHLGKLLDIFLSQVQQANYNGVVISHEIEAETEGKKRTLVPFCGTRNFSRNVAKYFDHVVYSERKNNKHIFASSTTYASNIVAGSRKDIAIEKEEKPSLLSILESADPPERKEVKKVIKSDSSSADILARLKSKK